MIGHGWIVGVRSQLVNLASECDSCAAIDGSKLTPAERTELQDLIRKAYTYIDKKLYI